MLTLQTTWSETTICYTIILILILILMLLTKWVAVILNCYIDVKPLKTHILGKFLNFLLEKHKIHIRIHNSYSTLLKTYTHHILYLNRNIPWMCFPNTLRTQVTLRKDVGQSLFVPLNTYPTDTNAAFSMDATKICCILAPLRILNEHISSSSLMGAICVKEHLWIIISQRQLKSSLVFLLFFSQPCSTNSFGSWLSLISNGS